MEAGQADAGRRPGRDAGREVRREGHPPARARPAVRAVPLQRPRRRRGHRPAVGRHEHRLARAVRAAGRVHRLAALARHPHLLPDRLLEPDRRPRPLGVDVPDPRPRDAADHRARQLLPPIEEPEPPVLAPMDRNDTIALSRVDEPADASPATQACKRPSGYTGGPSGSVVSPIAGFGHSGGGPTFGLQASPGWNPNGEISSRTNLGICPQDWACPAVGSENGGYCRSSCPE